MIMFVAPLAGRLSVRFGPRTMMTFGMTLATVGMVGLAQLGVDSSYNAIWPFFAIIGIGMASTMPAVTATAMGSVDPRQSGIASGVVNASRQIGGALGIALLGAVASQATTSAWASKIASLALPEAVTKQLLAAGDAVVAGRAGVVAAAGEQVHAAALESFVQGMDRALWVGGGLTACAAVLAFTLMPRVAPSSAPLPPQARSGHAGEQRAAAELAAEAAVD
jgi:MFS family permease